MLLFCINVPKTNITFQHASVTFPPMNYARANPGRSASTVYKQELALTVSRMLSAERVRDGNGIVGRTREMRRIIGLH
jgi:hypothetical protein